MERIDPLVLAGEAAAILEQRGFVACGRREEGVTRVDFWSRDGEAYRYVLRATDSDAREVAAMCRAIAMAESAPESEGGKLYS